MFFIDFLFEHVFPYITLLLAFYAIIDIGCVIFFDRHLFRSKYLDEPSWKNVFLRMKEKR